VDLAPKKMVEENYNPTANKRFAPNLYYC
jgi:hypothetical protein